ncbi:MAG: F0F1 ATP synthase subunit A [Firmicutes bacterium]|nr:F0F1 ATP synthase subunit A [Bacillota bacterium]
MSVNIHGSPILYTIPVLGGINITSTLVITWCVMIALTLLCRWLTKDLKVKDISRRQAVAEYLVRMAENFVLQNMGESWGRYVPFIAAIFSLSICSSLTSLLGLHPPTGDVSTELAWAIVVFVLITYHNIKSSGLGGYLKGFTEPIFLMTPFNVLGELFKPVSMSFRHFGNIVSGVVISALVYTGLMSVNHMLFGLLPGKVGELLGSIPFLAVGVPAVLSLYFDWFSSFMQAFIFCVLTMVFISSAAGEE